MTLDFTVPELRNAIEARLKWLDVTLDRVEWPEEYNPSGHVGDPPVLDVVLRSLSGRGRERIVRLTLKRAPSPPAALDDVVARVEAGVGSNDRFFEYADAEGTSSGCPGARQPSL